MVQMLSDGFVRGSTKSRRRRSADLSSRSRWPALLRLIPWLGRSYNWGLITSAMYSTILHEILSLQHTLAWYWRQNTDKGAIMTETMRVESLGPGILRILASICNR